MKNKNIKETIKLIDMEYDNISWNPKEFYSNGFKPVENLSQLPSGSRAEINLDVYDNYDKFEVVIEF